MGDYEDKYYGMPPQAGRFVKDDASVVNLADVIEEVLSRMRIREARIAADGTITFANEAAADDQQVSTITKPDNPAYTHQLVIYNPSTVTDLTVKIFSVQALLGGDTRDALIDTLSIPYSQPISGTTVNCYAKYIDGIFNGTNCKLVFSNDTVLGAAEGFSTYYRLWALR